MRPNQLASSLLPGLALALFLATPARATTLDFEGIWVSGSAVGFDDYGGLVWHQNLADGDFPLVTATVSPVTFVLPTGGTTVTVTIDSGTFDFNSVWLAAWDDPSTDPVSITVSGFADQDDAIPVESEIVVATATFALFSFGFAGIEKLEISGAHSGWAMDDFTFDEAIPEPHLAWLVAAGALALAGVGRR